MMGLGITALVSLGAAAAPAGAVRRTMLSTRSNLRMDTVKYGGIQHAGVLVQDKGKALDFYLQVLTMDDDSHLRPNLPYDGAFVRCGTHQIHLMVLPNPDPLEGRPEHGGRDRHVAVTVESIEPLKENLERRSIPFTMSKSGRRALFCRDPDGNALEFMEASAVRSA